MMHRCIPYEKCIYKTIKCLYVKGKDGIDAVPYYGVFMTLRGAGDEHGLLMGVLGGIIGGGPGSFSSLSTCIDFCSRIYTYENELI